MTRVEEANIDLEIKNFFFLIKRGFTYAFAPYLGGTEKNHYRLGLVLGQYSEFISRKLIGYVF